MMQAIVPEVICYPQHLPALFAHNQAVAGLQAVDPLRYGRDGRHEALLVEARGRDPKPSADGKAGGGP